VSDVLCELDFQILDHKQYRRTPPPNLPSDIRHCMKTHIKVLSSSCFYHIRSFKQIRSSLDHDMAISVASALVSSRLDHLNSIL